LETQDVAGFDLESVDSVDCEVAAVSTAGFAVDTNAVAVEVAEAVVVSA